MVTLVEVMDSIMPVEDTEVSFLCAEAVRTPRHEGENRHQSRQCRETRR